MIKRMIKFSYVKIFDVFMDCLEVVRGDDERVKEVGVDIVSELVEQIKEIKGRMVEGFKGFYFYMFNLEKVVLFIVERIGLIFFEILEEDEFQFVVRYNFLLDI